MPAAHASVPATFALPMPPVAVSFDAFLARRGLPPAEGLPTRARALAWAAYTLAPRYVGHSEPPRAMSRARAECREMQDELCALARAVVACDSTRRAVS